MLIKDKNASTARQNGDSRKFIEACSGPESLAFSLLSSGSSGLSDDEAANRLEQHGRNVPSAAKKSNLFLDILDRIKNPLVIQLLVICTVCIITGQTVTAIIIGVMILLSVGLSTIQERRSIQAAEELKKMVQSMAIVIRNGRELEIDMAEVVPGDIVVLAAGSVIPADLRILSTKDFFVNQSAMTGESMPVEKFPSPPAAGSTVAEPLELPNACFQGSTVVSGTARGIAVLTGAHTTLGAISLNVTQAKVATSFDKGVKGFVWLMIRFMLVMVGLVFLIVGITKHNWADALVFGLSVAVGLTPEMLPMIITVCLSKGAILMSKKKVIVKQLKAIQNIGAMNILCTDKTGTLTQDRIILERYVDVSNRPSDDVLRYAYMNSYYQTGLRNLLDRAILSHSNLDVELTCKKVDELPFDFERKRMSVIIDYEDTHVLICKGSVEDINKVSSRYQIDDDIFPLFDMVRNDIREDYEKLSTEGYRVLAVAYREFTEKKETFTVADESDLILLGYLAFFDPPKESAAQALTALQGAGVAVKVLTGDNELVTGSVCKNVGFAPTRVVLGRELSTMNEEQLGKAVKEANVFARLSPLQKEQIIDMLRKQGNTVGFLGDGINDAPALKAADVGISVDTAVDIAKESADIILLERSLLVLQDGITEGRRVFANIAKYIKMGSSSNFGNMFSVLGGSYLLPFLPMAPLQVLLNNLLYDISQTSIPTDRVDADAVAKPLNWDVSFVRKFMMALGPISSIFDYATFGLMYWFFRCGLFSNPATSLADKVHYEHLFHTGWFVESLITQTMVVWVLRTNKIPFLQSKPSTGLFMTTLGVMIVAIALPFSPFHTWLGLEPLPPLFWAWMAGFCGLYVVIAHSVKSWFNKKFGV